AQRTGAAGKEALRQRDEGCGSKQRRGTDARVAREYPLLRAEGMIGGVLRDHAPKGGFRSEDAGSHASVERGVVAVVTVQGIVTLIADVAEAGHAHANRLGEQRNGS